MAFCVLERCMFSRSWNFSALKIRNAERKSFCSALVNACGTLRNAKPTPNAPIVFCRSYSRIRFTYLTYSLCRIKKISQHGPRSNSTVTSTQIPNVVDVLPEPPIPPGGIPGNLNSSPPELANSVTISDVKDVLSGPPVPSVSEVVDLPIDFSGLVEPTLASQGLAGWSPVGILQGCLEYLHINLDIPWWLAIAIATVVIRTIMFPLVILSQRNAANMNNNMPQMQLLQKKMTDARNSGNHLEAGHLAQELMVFMKEKQINPFKGLIIPAAQAPVFMSFFLGLRSMANLPVASFKVGGIWWFTNLTIADPLYLLPLITSATLFVTIELGVEGGIRAGSMQNMKYIMRCIPVVIFPIIMNFPSAMLCYWVSNNAISLVQVAFLRIEKVRAYLQIPALIKHDPSSLPMKKKFVEGFRESYRNSKIARELEERTRIDDVQFRKAGIGPIQKTYSYDPTKQASSVGSKDSKKKV